MTINLADNTPRVSYAVAAGVTQTSFTVSFEFFDDADLNVYVDETLKTLTTDYTVTGGDGATGSITMSVTGAAGGSTVVITRDIDLKRTTDFPASGAFQVGSLNTELDKLIAIAADLDDKASRALQLTDYDTAVSLVLPDVDTRKGKTLAFNASTGAVESGPSISDVQTVSAASADIATLADIEDGTDATDAIQTVAGISANVTTVAGISSNVTTVAGNTSNINAVAADATDIGTVATNISSVNTVAGNISEVVAVANDLNEAVSEVETVANDLNEAVSEIETVAASISNVDTVGTNITNVNTVAGIDSNVTTVAGISANVTTVAGISGNVTTVAGISGDVTTVAADGTDIGTVATNIANVNTVAGINSNVTTVAGNNANVTTVANSISNVNTVASSIGDVNTFANQYRIAATAPTTSLDEGDLYFDTTQNQMFVYTGSAWEAVSPDLVGDATPQLGGDLDTNGNDINFGDNAKAVFGAGSDLQVYHSGTHSWINENGTGNLYIQSSGAAINVTNGSSRNLAQFNTSAGTATLFHDNGTTSSAKVATSASGIDVTGNVNITGGTITAGASGTSGQIDAPESFVINIDSDNNSTTRAFVIKNNGSAEIARFTEGGNVGIGTDSPADRLHVFNGSSGRSSFASNTDLIIEDNGNAALQFASPNTNVNAIYFSDPESNTAGVLQYSHITNDMSFDTADTTRMTIASDGNVGIGNTAPSEQLSLYKSGANNAIQVQSHNSTPGSYNEASLKFALSSSASSTLNWDINAEQTGLTVDYEGSEAARFDSSGNLLVGTTNTTPANSNVVGISLNGSLGSLQVSRDGSTPFALNRKTSDGDLVSFKKDGTTVGSIRTASSAISIESEGAKTGLLFGGDNIYPRRSGSFSDGTNSLGGATYRFKDLYLSGGAYIGGTAAANKLDDYEEGTWTPTVGGTATYTAQEGHYTKIGDLVHARCTIVINSIGSGATTNISGLPFTCKSGTNGMGQINVGYWSNFKTNTIAPGGFVAAGTTTVYFTGSDASASSVDYPFDFIQNGTRIDYDLTYRV